MAKDENVCEDTRFTATNGASTNRKTSGANPNLEAGRILRYACVEMAAANPPVHATIHVVVNGKPVELKSAWVRGGHKGALKFPTYFPIPKRSSLFFAVRNDTGADRSMTAHWVTEARPRV